MGMKKGPSFLWPTNTTTKEVREEGRERMRMRLCGPRLPKTTTTTTATSSSTTTTTTKSKCVRIEAMSELSAKRKGAVNFTKRGPPLPPAPPNPAFKKPRGAWMFDEGEEGEPEKAALLRQIDNLLRKLVKSETKPSTAGYVIPVVMCGETDGQASEHQDW